MRPLAPGSRAAVLRAPGSSCTFGRDHRHPFPPVSDTWIVLDVPGTPSPCKGVCARVWFCMCSCLPVHTCAYVLMSGRCAHVCVPVFACVCVCVHLRLCWDGSRGHAFPAASSAIAILKFPSPVPPTQHSTEDSTDLKCPQPFRGPT